jgi:hypothetical protein
MTRNAIHIQRGAVKIEATWQKPHLLVIAQLRVAKQIGRLTDKQKMIRGKIMPAMRTCHLRLDPHSVPVGKNHGHGEMLFLQ